VLGGNGELKIEDWKRERAKDERRKLKVESSVRQATTLSLHAKSMILHSISGIIVYYMIMGNEQCTIRKSIRMRF
jgi:hypothetical protein